MSGDGNERFVGMCTVFIERYVLHSDVHVFNDAIPADIASEIAVMIHHS